MNHTISDLLLNTEKQGECLVWKKRKTRQGYGMVHFNGKRRLAHRVAYELANQNPPGELNVCHHCDNPPCINPEHLFLGTFKDNYEDCWLKGRVSRGSKSPKAKLTEEMVSEMRNLRLKGKTLNFLASKFSVSVASCSYICGGTSWKHVPMPIAPTPPLTPPPTNKTK